MKTPFLRVGDYAINLENVAYIEIGQGAAQFNFTVNLPEPLTVSMTPELRGFLEDPEVFRVLGASKVTPLSAAPEDETDENTPKH